MTNPNSPQSLSADQLQTWLDAYQENQRQIVRAHDAYQAALQEGLQTFMETMAHTQAQLAGVMQRLGLDADVTTPAQPTAPKPITAPRTPRPLTPSPKPSAPQTQQQALSSSALEAELLKTVADKTGYPQEMLEMDMALEEDLGIDSIKRVEILSALRDKHPELPEVDGNAMANIHTLNDVITHLRSTQNVARAQTPPQAPTTAQTKPSNGRGAAVSAQDLEDVLLDTVAQKTGYPKEMLELDMTLEEDLGIDSIKRVEIMSALRDRAPHLPEVNADHMVQLRTLDDIVQFMRETSSVGASANFF